MKKFLAILLAMMSMCLVFAGCNGGTQGEEPAEPTYYTVTFKQEGQADVTIRVESGKGISASEMPTPKPVEGYTVVWEDVDLSSVTKDMTVNAIKTYNGMMITLVYPAMFPKELITVTEIKIKTGEEFTLPTLNADPEVGGYEIEKWIVVGGELDGQEFPFSGTYVLSTSITLKAKISLFLN